MLDRLNRIAASAGLALLASLTACGEPEEEQYQEEELPPPAEEEDPAESPEMGPEEMEPEELEMEAATDDPSVMGEATIIREGGLNMISVDLEGLPEAGEFDAHVHEGTCEEGGGVAVELEPVMALEDGTGTSMTQLEDEELPEDDWFIQVHGEDGSPISCGDADEMDGMDEMDEESGDEEEME